MVVAAAAMTCLLGVLAVLQYHWVGQLSADERDRMRAHLSTRADGFADDFNRELTRAFFWLQIGSELPRDAPLPSEVERFERWYASAPRPELVRAIYQVDLGDRGEMALHRFERTPARLEPADWPRELAPLRARLEELVSTSRRDPSQAFRLQPVWPEIPALLMTRVRLERGGGFRMTTLGSGPGSGYTIALLDTATMQRDLIPALVERHFGLGDDAVYVGITGPRGFFYAAPESTPPPALTSSPDVQEGLFEIRFFEFTRFVERRHAEGGANAGPPPAPPPGPRGTSVAINVFRDERSDRGRNGFRAAGPGSGPSASQSPWRIHVLHRAGSLEAAVARARIRNLLVSFGVLVLLGASMGMVLVSTGRARRLAAQQMEFVAGVSHELRTPLAVIRSAAENLADGIVVEPKQVRKYGDVIAAEGRRLTQMVEQIMDFAGFESGRATLDVRPADVASLVDEALRAVAPHLREHGADVQQTAPLTLPPVLVDPGAVSRSLQNLIVNALKYGGHPPRIGLTSRESRGEVLVTVEDNGAGIAARDLPHIFEPFYRGADATARQIHGSGLGLSLVKRIMDDIGGRVTVETEAGKGSAFTLHLPVAPQAETAPTTSASTTAAQHV